MSVINDALDKFGFNPSGWNIAGLGKGVTIFLILILIAIVVGIITYFVMMRLKFNKKIVYLEERVGYGNVPAGKDRAMVVNIDKNTGLEVFYTRRRKQYLQSYGKMIGKNQYAFSRGSDGYWRNITFGTVDSAAKQAGITLVHPAVRYAQSGMRKAYERRFTEKNWVKENLGLIVGGVFIIIVLIFIWLSLDKLLTAPEIVAKSAAQVEKVADKLAQVAASMDNVCSGGSGLRPV